MMYEAGFGGGTPIMKIAMLTEALLRNVRCVVALGEHTGDLRVEQTTQLFRVRGFVDPGNAKQQAVRGTFDPMFLVYTLGELIIRKLHTDYLAAHPGSTLGQFHDALLAHGCAPSPTFATSSSDRTPAL